MCPSKLAAENRSDAGKGAARRLELPAGSRPCCRYGTKPPAPERRRRQFGQGPAHRRRRQRPDLAGGRARPAPRPGQGDPAPPRQGPPSTSTSSRSGGARRSTCRCPCTWSGRPRGPRGRHRRPGPVPAQRRGRGHGRPRGGRGRRVRAEHRRRAAGRRPQGARGRRHPRRPRGLGRVRGRAGGRGRARVEEAEEGEVAEGAEALAAEEAGEGEDRSGPRRPVPLQLRKAGDDGRRPGGRRPWIVLGLGNPDDEYGNTPAQRRAMVVARLADRAGAKLKRTRNRAQVAEVREGDARVVLARPNSYVNESGGPASLLARYKAGRADHRRPRRDRPGLRQLAPRGGTAGHNGLETSPRRSAHPTSCGSASAWAAPRPQGPGRLRPGADRQARRRGLRRPGRAGRRRHHGPGPPPPGACRTEPAATADDLRWKERR